MLAKDHEGREFSSLTAMAKHWGMSYAVLSRRLNAGWSVEAALTTPVSSPAAREWVVDGKRYYRAADVAEAYGLKTSTLYYRVSHGLSLDAAVHSPLRRSPYDGGACACKDHLGNEYPNKTAMCRAYGKTRQLLKHRLDKGWSLGDALTRPIVPRRFGGR